MKSLDLFTYVLLYIENICGIVSVTLMESSLGNNQYV